MKTAISIPNPVFDEAEALARRLGISRSELYTRAVKALIGAHRNRRITARLNEVYTSEESSLEPPLARLQSRALRTTRRGVDEW